MACAFVAGARESKDGKIPLVEADRATNELLDTGSVGCLGVRLWVRLMDGLTGSDPGGWYVGYEEEANEDAPLVIQ